MYKKIPLLCISLLVGLSSMAQNELMFPTDSLEMLLLKGMNKMRQELNYDTLKNNDILNKAAELQAIYMCDYGKVELKNRKKKHSTTAKRLVASGGSKNGEEVVCSISVSKGRHRTSAKVIAETILEKWEKSKKEKPIITNGNYMLYGIATILDEEIKNAYISVTFSGYDISNDGVKRRKELAARYTTKNKKLKAGTIQSCKNCNKFNDYDSLRSGLYINEDGYVCLKYYNLKALKKLFKKSTDGVAVDIIQRDQYFTPGPNIYDNNLFTKGILLKPITGEKLFKNNITKYTAKTKGKKAKREETLNSPIGKFPKKIVGDYEMNLIIFQDNGVCKIIKPLYIESGVQKSVPCDMLLMPDSAVYLKPMFEPKAESGLLTFKVPFEKNKFDYQKEDILPFLDALQEPDFTIEGVYITAYSSIEGDSVANALLQKKRANSIIAAIDKMNNKQNKSDLLTNITTSDSWLLFTMEMEDGEYDYLTKMPKHKAIHEINTKPGLVDELEPFLAKERFGEMILDVTYDVNTLEQEINLCVSKFNSAIREGNIKQATKIQYYIEKNIDNKRFPLDVQNKLIIPNKHEVSGLLMNRIVYDYFRTGRKPTLDHFVALKEILAIDPNNSYLKYNHLFCKIYFEPLVETAQITEAQNAIDNMYAIADFPKRYVNLLNTELQFKIMDAMDSIDGSELVVQNCINKIKSYYNYKKANWQNSLKLAYSFMKHKEYSYSADLLEPFIKAQDVNEDVVFTFISACSNIPERMASNLFLEALRKAHELNADRYCKLFGYPNLTFQILDNPLVKEDYFNFGCQ